jgi:hypothetical protein
MIPASQLCANIARAHRCPMPVWQPDPKVNYAILVIGVDRRAENVAGPGLYCANPYRRSAADR